MTGPIRRIGRSVAFVTMGCAKNEVDSDHMALRLAKAGYLVCDDPESADVVIVNTCSFIQAATEESIDAILEVAGYESVASGEARLVVAGCMPARYGADLAAELPEAAGFVPCADESGIVAVVDAALGVERMPASDSAVELAHAPGRVSAYVKISDGCDRRCSYCAIPDIRGKYHSYPYSEIHAEVERLVGQGAAEIVLIAQDTGRWGADFPEPETLASLLSRLAESWPSVWFRVMYIQPEGITDELVETVSAHGNICDYFDIPFQHATERILRSMHRRGSAASHLALIGKIRAALPDAAVRTTLIAGFPGETEGDFEELCSFIEEADFDYVGVFAYSREEGTAAFDLPGQLDEDEKLARAQALRDLADAACAPRIHARIGRRMQVLVCGEEEDGQLYGRAACQAPDVDGVCYLDSGEIGEFVDVLIEDALLYEMEGTVLR